MRDNKKGFSLSLVFLSLFIFSFICLVGWLVYDRQNRSNNQTISTANGLEENVEQIQNEESIVKTTVTIGKTSASVEHPSNWKVKEENTDLDGYILKSKTITSPTGNSLRLYDRQGIGGDCDYDNEEFVLVKKIPTKTEGVYFVQYDIPGLANFSTTGIKIDTSEVDIKNVGEGYRGSGVCQNKIGFYSFVNSAPQDDTGTNTVFVLVSSSNVSESEYTTYEDIKNDSEFIKMLESLTVD